MGFREYFSIVILGLILTGCGSGGGGGGGSDNTTANDITTTGSIVPNPVQSVEDPACTTELSTIFDQLLTETNRVRREQSLPDLQLSQKLSQAAQGHAEDMADNNYFNHTSPDGLSTIANRITAADYSFNLAAENLAAGYYSAIDVVTDWFNSPGHQTNLLNPDYTDVGFGLFFDDSPGVAPAEANYSNYWVQNFGRPTDSNSDVEAHYIPHPPENCNLGTIASADSLILSGAITSDASADRDTQFSFSTVTKDSLAITQPSFSGVKKDSVLLENNDQKSTSTPEPAVVLGLIFTGLGLMSSRRKSEP